MSISLEESHSDNANHYEMRAINRNNEELVRRRAIERIQVVVIFMERNLDRPLRVHALAEMAKMSQGHFYVLFKRAVGLTPIDYFIRLRIKRACELLSETSLLVKEIAGLVGYRDTEFFFRSFRLVNGLTPGEYRKMATRPAKWDQNSTSECRQQELLGNTL